MYWCKFNATNYRRNSNTQINLGVVYYDDNFYETGTSAICRISLDLRCAQN